MVTELGGTDDQEAQKTLGFHSNIIEVEIAPTTFMAETILDTAILMVSKTLEEPECT
jgi:hypothetical protein